MTTADPRPLTQRLKEDNWDLHEKAEHDTLPQQMVGGTLPKEVYIRMLEQGYLLHDALDKALAAAVEARPELGALIGDNQFHGRWYAEDLAHFGIEPGTHQPGEGTRRVLDAIAEAASEPLRVLGLHYVRQGATNGNRFVAMKLRPGYQLPMEDRGAGTVHLDPYGKQQRPMWDTFKVELDKLELTEDEKGTVVRAGREMFTHIIELHKDLGAELASAGSAN